MVHRKIRENETSVMLRNVTTHDIGVEFDGAAAIIANFSDYINPITHGGGGQIDPNFFSTSMEA